jgi:GT2 family glycosyltransferase
MDRVLPTVSILIVAYNSRDFIEACLSSIAEGCDDIPYEVLLIDNGQDGTDTFVQEHFPNIKLVPSQGNVGYGLGNNILAKNANPKSDLLILNPDTQVAPGAIKELVICARENPEFGALSGAPKSDDSEETNLPLLALPSIRGVLYGAFGIAHRNARKYLPKDTDVKICEMEALSGFFILIKRPLWDRVGGFDESFFLYGEDTDISKRMAKTGAKLGLVLSSQVKHHTGSGAHFSANRQHFKMLGNAHYVNKHFGPIKRNAYKLTLWIQCCTKYVGSSVFSEKSNRMKAMASAFKAPALRPWEWYNGYDGRGTDPRQKH